MARLSVIAVAALLLAGCQANPDPATGGFIDGVVGLGGGTYDQRVQQRQNQAVATRAEADRLARRAAELAAEQQALAAEESDLRRRLAQVNGTLSTVRRDLDRAVRGREADQAELRRRQRDLADLEQRLAVAQAAAESPAPDSAAAAEMAALEAESEALRRTVAALLGETVVE